MQKNVSISLLLTHHANDTSWHLCAFETKPRNTGNPGGAGRASSTLALADAVVTDAVLVDDLGVDFVLVILVDALVVDRVLVLVDSVLDDVLVDAVVDDCVPVMLVDAFVDDVVVAMLVDAVVDFVQLEVGVLDRTQQVLLLHEGFCT